MLAALATAGLEALWNGLATGLPWERVLEANLYLDLPRPAHWVALTGLALAAIPLLRRLPCLGLRFAG